MASVEERRLAKMFGRGAGSRTNGDEFGMDLSAAEDGGALLCVSGNRAHARRIEEGCGQAKIEETGPDVNKQ